MFRTLLIAHCCNNVQSEAEVKQKHTVHGHLGCQTQLSIATVYADMMIDWLLAGREHIGTQKQHSFFILHIT